jgi:hypothetical protein
LAAVATNRAKDARTIELSSKGKDKRTVRVAYIVSAPLWKASYRLTIPADDAATRAQLQGWAIVENLSGTDWKNVELTLVSGQPVMFKQALYRAYYVDRPDVPVEVVGRLLPNVDTGQTQYAPPPPPPAPRPAMAAPPVQMRPDGRAVGGVGGPQDRVERTTPTNMAVPAEVVAAQEGLTQVLFKFPSPVSVANGRTLSVPIINGDVPIKRQALYQPETSPRNPLASVRMMNDGASGLPPGIITIYERHGAPGSGDIAYVGDARLAALPPGDNRLLSYALDQKINVERDSARTDTLVRGIIAGGVLRYDTLQRQTMTYRVRAPAREGRQLLIETPRLQGWKLTKPDSPDIGTIEGKYRVPFDLKGGEAYTFEVVQEQTVQQQMALVDADVEQVRFFARAKEFDPKTRDQLARVIQLQGAVVAAEKVLGGIDADRQRIVQEQGRIRDNLGRVPTGSDLQRRYLATLDRQETELEALAKRRGEAEIAVQTAREAVSKYVASLG